MHSGHFSASKNTSFKLSGLLDYSYHWLLLLQHVAIMSTCY